MLALFLFSLLVVQNTAQIVGIWYWTWSSSVSPPQGTTHGFAFDGTWIDQAIPNTVATTRNKLPGTPILTVGGKGTRWTAAEITKTVEAINAGKVRNANYAGIAWDIEEGEPGLTNAFLDAFAAVKQQGLLNWVTVSHSTPFGFSDTTTLMKAILGSTHVDYISPQLYTSGTENGPDFAAVHGITWDDYKSAHATIVPSIPIGAMYDATYCHFKSRGITLGGYIQWQQSGHTGNGPTTPTCPDTTPVPSPIVSLGCGTSWATASCSVRCPKGKNSECPAGQLCFAGLACSSTENPPPPPSSTIKQVKGCGTNWKTAGCAILCPAGLDSECPKGQQCFAGVSCPLSSAESSSANEGTIVTETQNSDGTTTTLTITNSGSIPAYGVALLAIASVIIVVLVVLIALVSSKKKRERV